MRVAVACLFALLGCDQGEKPAQAPPRVKPHAATPAEGTRMLVERVSPDGTRALLRDLSRGGERDRLHFRVVSIDTGATEADLDLPIIAGLAGARADGVDDDALSAELRNAGRLLAGWPLGASDRIAASPDGHHVAFNVGDELYTAVDGRVIGRVSSEPSYRPWFTPDGKTLLFIRENGMIDGTLGKYELFATSVDGTAPPRRIDGTAGILEPFALTANNTAVRFVASSAPHIPTCLVEVSLAHPDRAKNLGCLADPENVITCVLSPSADYAACGTSTTVAEAAKYRYSMRTPNGDLVFQTRVLSAASGESPNVVADSASPAAISDDGTLVIEPINHDQLVIVPREGEPTTIDVPHYVSLWARFRNAHELLVDEPGTIRVLDIAR